METAIFFLFAGLAVVSAGFVVAHKNPVYATMSLVVTLFSTAVLFVLLGAPFLGVLQLLIYAGAIVVLFLFVIMLLNIQREEGAHEAQMVQRWSAVLGAAVFCGMVATLVWRTRAINQPPLSEQLVSMRGLAVELFDRYLLAFEIVGLLLLVAVIAATVVARKPGGPQLPEVSRLAEQKAGDAVGEEG